MITAVLLPLILLLPLSLLLEQRLLPGVASLRQRPCASLQIQLGLLLLAFALLLPLLQRPWFALALISAFQLLLVLVNNAKLHSLREPFLAQDFEYFTDAIRHPRLYLPFFGVARTLLATLGGLVAVVAGLWLEPSLVAATGWGGLVGLAVALALLGGGLLWLGQQRVSAVQLEPAQDMRQLGFYAYLWAYGVLARQPLQVDASALAVARQHDREREQSAGQPAADSRPHLLVVQSESFFDPRRPYPFVADEVLDRFDRLRNESVLHGRLRVPAWGANTVRTECGFLTGLTPEQLGVHQFNPYHQLSRRSVPNLAATLRAAGYRTVCIHPYPASFYLRDRVFPRLGFEQFIGIEAFDAGDRQGQYVGDLAVARQVHALLAQQQGAEAAPLFIFVITMENHGPLHLEQPDPEAELGAYRAQRAPEGCRDLTVYLQHLANADRMIEQLRTTLAAGARPGMLCWYGDHVPIMAEVYARYGEPDGLTDYLIWRTGDRAAAQQDGSVETDSAGAASSPQEPLAEQQELSVDQLAPRLLALAGLGCHNQSV